MEVEKQEEQTVSDIPLHILETHIFPLLPIDTRLNFKVLPGKIPHANKKVIDAFLQEKEIHAYVHENNIKNGELRFLDIRKRIGNLTYSYEQYFLDEYDAFLAVYENENDVLIRMLML